MQNSNWNISSKLGCQLALNEQIKFAEHQQKVIDRIDNVSIPKYKATIQRLENTIKFRDNEMQAHNDALRNLLNVLTPEDSDIQFTATAGYFTVPNDLEAKVEQNRKHIEQSLVGRKEAEYKLKFHKKNIKELEDLLKDAEV